MPTPSELRVAKLRDQLAVQDFVVHEVVEVEPTSSDEDSDGEGDIEGGWYMKEGGEGGGRKEEKEKEEEGDGTERVYEQNMSMNSNEFVSVTEAMEGLGAEELARFANGGEKKGKWEGTAGRVSLSPEKNGGGGDFYGVD
ncbi:hypothetical protein TrRE_jg819 [Triparma retinervis]|uniref:Uncharacterized protein n=1 Tax=Triparma retinervis TaxID=2557542 RepID=A0A9W7E7Z3_9STRA|nr:hypothetical protein TrRE_jg819 [Triparma retinervis]